MKKMIQRLLSRKVQALIHKHQPRVIAVTGSVGKTSTKGAIAAVLGKKFHVRTSPENYNNEFGVPLAILGLKSPGRSVFGWLKVLFYTEKDFPDILILEFGADRPGDIRSLCDLVLPEVGVVTAISPVHVEFFGTIEALADEKAELVRRIPGGGLVVLNADDDRVIVMRDQTKTNVLTYGTRPADIRGSEYTLTTREDFSFEPEEIFSSIAFCVHVDEEERKIVMKDMLGSQQMSAILAAITVGKYFGLSLEEIEENLKDYQLPPGRLKPIPGIKGCLILDDSYNAAPASMAAALTVLQDFHPVEHARRIAVLSDMAELGNYSQDEHRRLGFQVAAANVDLLICVGEKARDICRGAAEAGIEAEKLFEFSNIEEAGRWLDRNVHKGDIVLVKGSQGMRMEKIVKEIMAEPLRASELLVRQYGKWLET